MDKVIDHRNYPEEWLHIPSVTEILKVAGLMDDFSNGSQWHMDRGSFVHKAIELFEAGDLDEDELDPQIEPYLTGWKWFKADSGWVTEVSEVPLLHPVYNYKGKPDLIGMFNKNRTLLDIKTGTEARWHVIQAAAYKELLSTNQSQVAKDVCLYLSGDGKYKLSKSHSTRQDLNVFLSALAVERWKEKK